MPGTQEVIYEWKPIRCEACKGIGHTVTRCIKREKKMWVAKDVQKPTEQEASIPKPNRNTQQTDADGFQLVKRGTGGKQNGQKPSYSSYWGWYLRIWKELMHMIKQRNKRNN